ncbi:unnamed protein product [Lymnaea stagnalis]|uniref:TATA box-binding protein-associated factor RNA polymerase I subunit B n=1 Tax=Lymnaea stagnalis TaxID=6523 RepID=A0AAV2H098_LYMST
MPFSCQVCDSEQYDEEDGLFYCTECGTQSQELIVQEVNDTCTEVGVRYEVKSAKKSTSSVYRPKADLGRPWMIYEAYQIIILAQADALISLGAKQELKDTVFTLWANYLSRLGIAFCKDEQPVANIVKMMRVGRLRELHRGTFENPSNRKKRPFHEDLSGLKSATDEAKKVDFYEEDTPLFEGKENIVFINEDDDSRNHKARYIKAVQSPEWMHIKKTISLCYIGLMFTDKEILPFDLLRWVYESKVPYLSTTHLLPNDMVLSAGDQALFETNQIDTSTFITEINKLLAYLELKNMPSPDLKRLISRFVKELHLPEELACISCRLVNKIPFIKRSHLVYSKKEVLAMGYIILAVKLVFGLNDDSEWSLSKYSKQIQDLLNQEIKIFVWSDWKKFMIRKCSKNFNAYRALTSDVNKSKLCHLDQLLACYADTQIDKKRLTTWSTLNSKQRLVHRFEAEFKDSLRKPLEIALSRFGASHSFTEVSESRNLDDEHMQLHEDFTCATVAHIVNVNEFKDKIGKIATDKETELYKIIVQYSTDKPAITQYGYLTREEDLAHNRHYNYLWFLHVASENIDCKLLELDKLTVRLTDYLVTASSGVDMTGVVCTWFGNFPNIYENQPETKDASQDLFE